MWLDCAGIHVGFPATHNAVFFARLRQPALPDRHIDKHQICTNHVAHIVLARPLSGEDGPQSAAVPKVCKFFQKTVARSRPHMTYILRETKGRYKKGAFKIGICNAGSQHLHDRIASILGPNNTHLGSVPVGWFLFPDKARANHAEQKLLDPSGALAWGGISPTSPAG